MSAKSVCPLLDLAEGTSYYTLHTHGQTELQIATRNLPVVVPGFSYKCKIGDMILNATRNNETSITCQVTDNKVLSCVNISENVAISIAWVGPDVTHTIDSLNTTSVILYNCNELGMDCSSCVGSRATPGYNCGWSNVACSFLEEHNGSTFITAGMECPNPNITSFSPTSGPPSGGSVIEIHGTDLGVTFDDFKNSSIIISGEMCSPVNRNYYISGRRVFCRTGAGMEEGTQEIEITLFRTSGTGSGVKIGFLVVLPSVTSVKPRFGPIAGGSVLTITGTGLDIGTIAIVGLDTTEDGEAGPDCTVLNRTATTITCRSAASASISSGFLSVQIDEELINSSVQFEYRENPIFIGIRPKNTIPSGGIRINFTGTGMNVSQSPQLYFGDQEAQSSCSTSDDKTVSCIVPNVTTSSRVRYRLIMDDIQTPDFNDENFILSVKPDPSDFTLITNSVSNRSYVVQINGQNLDSVHENEIGITIGGIECGNLRDGSTPNQILCAAPTNPELDESKGAIVTVRIGRNLNYVLNKTLLYAALSQTSTIPPSAVLPAVLTTTSFIFLGCVTFTIMLLFFLQKRSKRRQNKLLIEMREIEYKAKEERQDQEIINELARELPPKLIIPSSDIRILDIPLGRGQFGMVYKAHLVKYHGFNTYTEEVAVKILKGILTLSSVESMISEIKKMHDLCHPNILTLVGVCASVTQGPSIILPYMANGNLLNYLKNERKNLDLDHDAETDQTTPVRNLLLKFCLQISHGMEYLSSQMVIHRDLAARNCMIDDKGQIKVADFGLAEDIYNTGYYKQDKGDPVRLPFKWMALESLMDGYFSQKSDVWSFGVTCWEVFSIGRSPYPAVDAIDLPGLLRKGMRLEYPNNPMMTQKMYNIMCRCWRISPKERPLFKELSSLLDERLQSSAGYMEMKMALCSSEVATL